MKNTKTLEQRTRLGALLLFVAAACGGESSDGLSSPEDPASAEDSDATGDTDTREDASPEDLDANASTSPSIPEEPPTEDDERWWVGAWGAAPFGPYPNGIVGGPSDPLSATSAFVDAKAKNQSFRMIVHPTIGGEWVRVRLSNAMGNQPVTFDSVSLALQQKAAAVEPGSLVSVTFSGAGQTVIAPGDEAISDPVKFTYVFGKDVAVSFHVVGESGDMTWHQVSFGTNYIAPSDSGDKAGEIDGKSLSNKSLGWFFVSGLDVFAERSRGTIVAIGDSITDGTMMTLGSNTRWTDLLAARLHEAGTPTGIVNEGINGNTVRPSSNKGTGPGAVDRFERDVMQRPNVQTVIVFEGTNDLGGGATAAEVSAAHQTLIERARQGGVCVILATITPRASYTWSNADQKEAIRQALNTSILGTSDVRGVIDFDKAIGLGSPTLPNPAYFFVDGIHPTTAGFKAMANAIPLELLTPNETCGKGLGPLPR